MKQAPGKIESGIIGYGDDPLSRRFLRPISNVGKSNPESILAARSPEAPAVILLDRVGQFYAGPWGTREFLLQPRSEILSEATGVDEVRFHFSVLEEVSYNRDPVH